MEEAGGVPFAEHVAIVGELNGVCAEKVYAGEQFGAGRVVRGGVGMSRGGKPEAYRRVGRVPGGQNGGGRIGRSGSRGGSKAKDLVSLSEDGGLENIKEGSGLEERGEGCVGDGVLKLGSNNR